MTAPARPGLSTLMAPPNPVRLPRILPTGRDPGLQAHLERWGWLPDGGTSLIEEVERAGLRGRGGAAFPTAIKLQAVAARRHSVVVANGTEGEPASAKDKSLLAGTPHLVLDGASLAAEAVGADEAIICVDRTATAAVDAVRTALAERARVKADRVRLRVEAAPGRYVAGEESALVQWLGGGDARPAFGPPRPFERGLGGRPTLVNNVETLAHLALIARFGAAWYRSLGTADDPGTTLVTLMGDVPRPGVYELPLGFPFAELLQATATGHARSTPQAVLVGGYAGTWVPGHVAVGGVTVDRTSLRGVGAGLGCGAISVIGPDRCGLIEVARVTRWLASQSAGQCGPCVHGLPAIASAVDALAAGERDPRPEAQLRRWLDMVEGRGACHHPDGVVRFVRSALAVFAADIDEHRRRGPCPPLAPVLPTPPAAGGWR
jgi:NADH:ubiquinone oxidoreductase subunit F (NADH-binding)